MLLVEVPPSRFVERRYAAGVVFGEYLGLPFELSGTATDVVRLSVPGMRGSILMPDTLLSMSESAWLTQQSLPKAPLRLWDPASIGQISKLGRPLPIIYGGDFEAAPDEPGSLVLPIDVFASVFFMLTRYEELVVEERDEHNRFPASASLACREGFLTRPIVDEYVETLWQAIRSLWPGMERKHRTCRTLISCDVDYPLSRRRTIALMARTVGADLVRHRSLSLAMRRVMGYAGFAQADPFNTFEWMMDVNERAGNQLTFFFVSECLVPEIDPEYDIHSDFIISLMKRLHQRGHLIGMHGSYASYASRDQLCHEAARLRSAMECADIRQDIIGARQHFLRWATPTTAAALEDAGVVYDSTLGYAQTVGYRCGTCREFPLFDLASRRELALRERPLLVMEGSVHADMYMGLGITPKALDVMQSLKQTTRLFDGDFTLLWHNSEFLSQRAKEHYCEVIA